MKVAVVILNYNGSSMLAKFLHSVVEFSPGADIVVADNASTDDSVAVLRESFPAVRLIQLDRNYGFADGYNKALEQVDAEYFLLLNSDVEVTDGWLEPLLSFMERTPDAVACQPKILAYKQKTHFEYAGAAGGFIDRYGYPYCRGRLFDTVEEDSGQYDDVHRVFWATGAAMMVRSAAFRKAGGFDGRFFAHMEEIDLCWRMQLMGYKIMVEPRSVVHHLGGGTLPNDSPRKLYLNYRNNLAMLFKCAPTWQRCIVAVARPLADALSAMVYFVKGQRELTKAVWLAYKEFFFAHKELGKKRRAVRSSAKQESQTIYCGSIVLRYALGGKRFDKMM